MSKQKRSVWIIEMLSDKKWIRSIDHQLAYVSKIRAEEEIKALYFLHGKNVTYRAVRYSAQTK